MRVGMLGAGLIATYHSKMLRASGLAVERAGVFDPDGDRAERFAAASGHHACSSAEEVLAGLCQGDAVYVCTWTSEHPALVAEAARRGLHVFCEKPLATSLGDAESMLEAVHTAGVVHQVGLVLRRSPAYVLARRLVRADEAGRVMAVVFRDDQYIPIQGQYGSTWRADCTKAGAGTLLEHSIHDLDLLEWLAGPVVSVSARSNAFHGIAGIEDVMSVSLGFASGAAGTLVSVWHDNLSRPSLRRVEVFCERRLVTIDGDDWDGPVSWQDSDGTEGELEGEALVAAAATAQVGDPNPDAAFVLACGTGGPAWPDFAIAVRAHRVADAIYRSAALSGAAIGCEP